jgi:serine/threonine-protein kinase
MEHIEGQTLLTQVRQSGPLSHENALRVAMNLVDALALLHSNKIIHRDIRPSNVLLGFDKRVVLVDLGLLKSVAETNFSRLTRTGNAAGDPRYQAPDLVLDIRTEDTRCDIYALGATLYFAVTGRQPFDSRNMMQLIRMVMNDMPPPPVELRPRLPGPMNNLILKAMAKDPSDRFQSMREMAQVLAGLSRT